MTNIVRAHGDLLTEVRQTEQGRGLRDPDDWQRSEEYPQQPKQTG